MKIKGSFSWSQQLIATVKRAAVRIYVHTLCMSVDTYLLPVRAIANVVEVPAGGENDL